MNMFKQINPLRLLCYLMILGLLPIFGTLLHLLSSRTELLHTEERIANLRYRALLQEQRQAANRAVVAHYRDADHFYIDKHLESVVLLEPEIEALQKVTANKNYPGDDLIQKRLEFLTGPGNHLAFTEGVVQSNPLFQETVETLTHTVEANLDDLKKLLSLIEGITIGTNQPAPNRPQLIILDFKIDKKAISEKNEVFVLNMKLLKREYL